MSVLQVTEISPDLEIAELRKLLREATTRLLGETIGIDDEHWQSASRLPGWTRAHVATHIAHSAAMLVTLIERLAEGGDAKLYGPSKQDYHDLERGSERSALELQIALDTSAGRLNAAFDQLDEISDAIVYCRNGKAFDAKLLVLLRLNEIIIHHVDLGLNYNIADITPRVAQLLLAWNIARPIADLPGVHIVANSGIEAVLGSDSPNRVRIEGADNLVFAWLVGRLDADSVSELEWPETSMV